MARRLSAALLAATVAAAVALVAPAPAPAAEKAIWGPLELPDGSSAFPTYRRLGVDTLQASVDFDRVAPERPANASDPGDPAYRWPASLDALVQRAGQNGIKVGLLVHRSPEWANGGGSAIGAPRPEAFADFLTAASRRYPSVKRWMVWGEPNRDDRFQPNGEDSPVAPRVYAKILDASYAALKRVSRRNIVIGGMTWTGGTVKPSRFLKFMRLPGGRPPRLDWFGHNPFPYRFPNLRELAVSGGFRDISDLDTFQRELRRAYGPRVRFWLSEFNVQSEKPSNTFELFVSRAAQARWLRAAYGIADRLDSVAGLGWLGLVDQPRSEGSENWGLLDESGSRKPAFGAYLAAPSVRFRPVVRAPSRVSRATAARRGVPVRVRPRARGRVTVELRTSGGRLVARVTRRARAGGTTTLRLRRRGLRGRYGLEVSAARGERVRRALTVR